MKYRENLGSLLSTNNKPIVVSPPKIQIGRVYGAITSENTPTEKQFNKWGGFGSIGMVLYKDYETSIREIGENSDDFFDLCETAFPISTDLPIPLPGELILLQEAPSANTQLFPNSIAKYYVGIVNLYNNTEQNAQPAGDKYAFKTYVPSENIKPLLKFEGDKVLYGRKGNSIRFSSTVKDASNLNEWSSGPGADGDPITIFSGGQANVQNSSSYIEKINENYSSIYLTSTQTIPLITDRSDVLNPLTNPTKVVNYYNSQILLNADRIVINSKKDDVLLFATTNIELNTKYIINLNANGRVHLNSPNIILGNISDNKIAEPLVLGCELQGFLGELLSAMSSFCAQLSSAKSSAEGADLIQIQNAATELNTALIERLQTAERLDKLISKQNFTL
jgi:hypothetical protein